MVYFYVGFAPYLFLLALRVHLGCDILCKELSKHSIIFVIELASPLLTTRWAVRRKLPEWRSWRWQATRVFISLCDYYS
jgi:hypothetical protein